MDEKFGKLPKIVQKYEGPVKDILPFNVKILVSSLFFKG